MLENVPFSPKNGRPKGGEGVPVPDPVQQGKPILYVGAERFAAAPPTAARRLLKSRVVSEIAQTLLGHTRTGSTESLIAPTQTARWAALLRMDVLNVVYHDVLKCGGNCVLNLKPKPQGPLG